MHELSIALEVVHLLEQQAKALSRITHVTLAIGALSCIEPEALRTALGAATRGTLAEGARLTFEFIPAQARCDDCQATFEPDSRIDPCPHCGSPRKTWLAGQELRIRNLEGLPLAN